MKQRTDSLAVRDLIPTVSFHHPWLLMCMIALVQSVNAQPNKYASNADSITTDLTLIEQHFFSYARSKESPESRLDRLEIMVFGECKTGEIGDRVRNLRSLMERSSRSSGLSGRLEQVVAPSVNLPVEIRAKALKPMIPRTDLREKSTPLLKGRLCSYPADWVGQWGGHLQLYSVDEQYDRKDFFRGTSGLIVCSFMKRANGTVFLLPTNLDFPPIKLKLSDTAASARASSEWDRVSRSGKVDPVVVAIPSLILRNESRFNIKKDSIKEIVLKNEIRLLKPDVLEQSIVSYNRTKTAQGAETLAYRETVIRLTRSARPDLLWAQIAHL